MATNASAEIDFIFPKEIYHNQPFKVQVISNINFSTDVKIYIQEDEKNHSEIFDNGWKNSDKYILNSYPKNSYYLIIPYIEGESKICLKLRKQDKIYSKCKEIFILDSNSKIVITKEYYYLLILFIVSIIYSLILLFLLLIKKI